MQGIRSYLRNQPLQGRTTLFIVALVVVAIVLSNVAGYAALRVTLYQATKSIALSMAQDLQAPAARALEQSGRLSEEVRQAGGVVVEVVDALGRVTRVAGETSELVLEPADLVAASAGAASSRTGLDSQGASYMMVSVPLQAHPGYALVVARPLGPVLSVLGAERLIVFCVVVGSTFSAAVAGVLVTRSALRPVRELTAAVQHVNETKDFQPISVHACGDLAVLSGAFNQLLRAVTAMRERQAQLVGDAGHELRTPLTSLTTNVDLLLADLHVNHLSDTGKAQILDDVRGQLSELSNLVNDLVHLSRDECAGTFLPLDLRDTVEAAVARARRRGSDRVFDVELREFRVVGDAAGLERMVTNLLDNAVKWSPAGSTIRVHIRGNRLTVADSGPGIPDADLPYVFDRFFRGHSARKTHGTGLGLSIVAKTVQDHGGHVRVGRSEDGGAQFTVQLPGVTHLHALPHVLIPAA